MNASSRRTLLAVAGCALGVAAALGWATVHALRLERRELTAQALAQHQSAIRVALWRMDAALTPILARETARPYFHYSAFFPSERVYTAMLEDVAPGEHLVPSPLLTLDQQFVKLYFQRSASGEVTSPQVPRGMERGLVEASLVGPERVAESEARLAALERILAGAAHGALAGRALLAPSASAGARGAPAADRQNVVLGETPPQAAIAPAQEADLAREYGARQQAAGEAAKLEKEANSLEQALSRRSVGKDAASIGDTKVAGNRTAGDSRKDLARSAGAPIAPAAPSQPAPPRARAVDEHADRDDGAMRARDDAYKSVGEAGSVEKRGVVALVVPKSDVAAASGAAATLPAVDQGDMVPTWRVGPGAGEPQLLLVRTVRVGEVRLEQGCWLDWPALRAWLSGNVQDLLPGAALVPVTDPYAQADPESLGRRLAGISAELAGGTVPVVGSPGWTPMRTTLVLTWGAVVLSFGAIGASLLAARDLAERRGQFVAAVTHELRTPLTTFCLYSQMLADGMVTEEGARREYLATLRSESDRLSRIVESVLEYARLGRTGRAAAEAGATSVGSLLERVVPVLAARAARAGVSFECEPSGLEEVLVRAEPVSVERILTNLLDNACKYAHGAPLRMSARENGRQVEILLRDGGPGIGRDQRARLFQPFERGSSLAHASVPGLGLGLALSRALARRMGGDLRLGETSARGSVFVLVLPRAHPGAPG